MTLRFLSAGLTGGALLCAATLGAGVHGASAQTECNLTCLQALVDTCADANSAVANWWEFGNGFQTCVAGTSPGQCSAIFQRVQEPSGFSILVDFRPVGSETNCIIATSER